MTTLDDWSRVKAILDGALAREGDARAAYLTDACGGDNLLRLRVETLIQSHETSGSFLDTPAASFLETDPAAPDLTGRTIGTYRFLQRIGAGAMGEVYLAHDDKLDRRVAVKLITSHVAADPERVRRFHQEARAASTLNHPHILVVHDFGELDGRPFIVTELVEGQTVRDRLRRGALPMREAVEIASQVLSALSAAHARGLVHRDIKPENLMVRPDGYVKVLDFGLAKLMASDLVAAATTFATEPGQIAGTPAYMSPEQARGEPVDARTDLFSAGAVLYEMLTGRRAFPGETTAVVFAGILDGTPPAPSTVMPALPAEVDRVVLKALEKRPELRYQTAADMRADLTSVHRHLHDKLGSVYAYRSELDARAGSRTPAQAQTPAETETTEPARSRRSWRLVLGAASGVFALILGYAWLRGHTEWFWRSPVADAQLRRVTDFGGVEQAAAISRDGRFIAFQSDRDGRMDIWFTQIGTGRFKNLTNGRFPELVNDQVRTLSFSPDGSLVTFWLRRADRSVSIWAVPMLGGEPQPYLENAGEFDWSNDGSLLVYHTTGAGDPMFIRNPKDGTRDRQIFKAGTGLHAHFPVWSPDRAFIYFVQAEIPESDLRHADIWRIKSTGGAPERITHHDSRVTYPVLVDDRTLMYLATDADGSGPWLYSVDVERRVPHRLSPSVDAYTSLAARADGRAFVMSVARPKGTLWRVRLADDQPVDASRGAPVSLTTGRGFRPRLGSDCLFYVSSTDSGDGIWKVGPEGGETAASLWSEPGSRIFGGPALDADGKRIAFSVERRGKTLLYVMNADGTGLHVVTAALSLVGAPAWQPDGRGITTAASVNGAPRLFRVGLDGSAVQVGGDYAVDPVWSRDGRIVVYSGPDVGTSFSLKALTADGAPYTLPNLTMTRGARRARFIDRGRALVVMRGDIKHKDLWLIDLDTGAQRQLTRLPPDFNVNDFDITGDGREVVLERVQAQSDVVLLTAQ